MLRLEFMKTLKRINLKQYFFYILVFLVGFLYQPNWVHNNFWLKAEFYDSLPFHFPYILFLLIYSILSVGATWSFIQGIKRYL